MTFSVFRNYWKSIAVLLAILYLSFAPPSVFRAAPVFTGIDKVVHILMYVGLTVMLIYDLKKDPQKRNNQSVFISLCIVFPSFLGGLIEIFQPILAPRSASWLDWLSDLIGVFIGFSLMKVASKYISKL